MSKSQAAHGYPAKIKPTGNPGISGFVLYQLTELFCLFQLTCLISGFVFYQLTDLISGFVLYQLTDLISGFVLLYIS